jgi:hypothetical protein
MDMHRTIKLIKIANQPHNCHYNAKFPNCLGAWKASQAEGVREISNYHQKKNAGTSCIMNFLSKATNLKLLTSSIAKKSRINGASVEDTTIYRRRRMKTELPILEKLMCLANTNSLFWPDPLLEVTIV